MAHGKGSSGQSAATSTRSSGSVVCYEYGQSRTARETQGCDLMMAEARPEVIAAHSGPKSSGKVHERYASMVSSRISVASRRRGNGRCGGDFEGGDGGGGASAAAKTSGLGKDDKRPAEAQETARS